ncbi:DNA/RNA non-specific endonuclease [Hymenobacter cellulosivorans]|uniref:DNA/RNA non-specific endonuclease n=1 Tax=Hymenobacter cellulosivorans TaxID=2932249 RepID=A0ABY4F8Q2_9BACT|nr:DNA/RNA non-specific endonuclease [Hymenobacter cellulosivorans]UOQ53048.1 DNA/RNA non-specific endonuclease [Hymenobacter cellulosivorans]
MKHSYRRTGRLWLSALVTLLWAGSLTSTAQTTTRESFETGTKPTYPASAVLLSTGTWTLDNALLGSSVLDHKNGTQALRLTQMGKATMDFFLPEGASTVTVQHALYGSEASSGFELYYQSQSCSCNKWVKVGSTVIASTATLQSASFAVNVSGPVRFELRKVSGAGAQLNLDDVVVTPYAVTPPPTVGDNDHLTMGNPSGAATDVNMPFNYLMRKRQFALSYHRDQGKPNWVSWYLAPAWLGSTPRQDNFRNDTELPAGWYQVGSGSYSGSGFDRGHNTPSADRTSSVADNSATFLMTNMIPQAPNNNQITWATLENYARTLVDQGNELYIIMGSYGKGGTGSAGYKETIDNGRVQVPNRVWKVIVVLPMGNNDVSRVGSGTRIIAVDTPNQQGLTSNWGQYRTSVDAIETATGLDLLSSLPTAVQDLVEATIDSGPTN